MVTKVRSAMDSTEFKRREIDWEISASKFGELPKKGVARCICDRFLHCCLCSS